MTTVIQPKIRLFLEFSIMGNENSGNRSNHGGERANFQALFLPTEMWIAAQKLIAKYEIGKAPAYLYCINETLHNEGFMNDEDYLMLKQRYLEPLIVKVKRERVAREAKHQRQLERTKKAIFQMEIEERMRSISESEGSTRPKKSLLEFYIGVFDQWNGIPEEGKTFHLQKIHKLKHTKPKEHEQILDLARKTGIPIEEN